MNSKTSSKVVVQLYRSLLRASVPFTYPAPHAALLLSLLHRKGVHDYDDSFRDLTAEVAHNLHKESPHSLIMKPLSADQARDLSRSYRELQQIEHYSDIGASTRDPPHHILFRFLLHELMGNGETLMRFPSQISHSDLKSLRSIIQREFRSGYVSDRFPYRVRIQTSFLALRELNKKICYAHSHGGLDIHSSKGSSKGPTPIQGVFPLPRNAPSSYLRPGTFLIAHPLIHGFFSRTVVAILDHTDASSSSNDVAHGGTYGLIINKPTTIPKKFKNSAAFPTVEVATVSDIFRDTISVDFHAAFNDCTIRTGGPVHTSVQMLYKCTPDEEVSLKLGGRVFPVLIPSGRTEATTSSTVAGDNTEVISAALESDDAIYFQGDFRHVAKALLEGKLSKDSVSFVVGATVWAAGQLQTEIERGWWMPCAAPPLMTLTGKSVLNSTGHKDQLEGPYLWSSIMAGISEEEAASAHLFRENVSDENIDACDEF